MGYPQGSNVVVRLTLLIACRKRAIKSDKARKALMAFMLKTGSDS